MKTFRKYLIVFTWIIGTFLPTMFVFAAGTCACTSSDKNCLPAALNPGQQSQAACDTVCKTKLGTSYTSSDYGDGTAGDAVAFKCNAVHQTFTAGSAAASGATPTPPPAAASSLIAPVLNVAIPNLTFSKGISGPCSYNEADTCIKTNYLGEYLNGLYGFLLTAAAVIAIVMIMVGGLQYTLGAANEEQAKKGKEKIKNSVTGLVLLLCVFLILQTINPQLVFLKIVELRNLDEVPMAAVEESAAISADSGPEEGRTSGIPGTSPVDGKRQLKYPVPNPLPILKPTVDKKGNTKPADTFINPPPRKCEKPSVAGVPAAYPGVTIDKSYFGNLDCNVSGKTMTSKRAPSSIKMVVLHEGYPGNNIKGLQEKWVGDYLFGTVQTCKQKSDGKWNHSWCTAAGNFLLPPTVHQTPIGSHYTLAQNGTFYALADEGFIMNHCCKENDTSIGIDLQYGGTSPNDKWTEAQYQALAKMIKALSAKYGFAINDNSVHGHCELGSHVDPPHFDLKHLGELLGFTFNLSKHSKKSDEGVEQCNWTPL